ncbi:MAG: DUF5057 domain-containing protein [Lachnospiraceae bacterium]|nr:DUF5057 domain-containing protein [Lachnospiraceae bacterium]
MRTELKILKNKIKNSLKSRSFKMCSVLIALVLVMSVVISTFMGNDDGANVHAEVTPETSNYINYILQYMNTVNNDEDDTNDKEFTILEVVPYIGLGEFYHYVENEEVYKGYNEYLLENDRNYKNNAVYKFTQLMEMSNFGYRVMYCKNESSYMLESLQLFFKQVMPDYAYELRDCLKVNVCEANDLTEEMIREADFIVVSTGRHDDQTLSSYNNWKGTSGTNCYDMAGNQVTAEDISYATYENITEQLMENPALFADRQTITVGDKTLVSRDASWEAASTLMEVCLEGRTFSINGEDVTIKTPVIMDNKKFDQLSGTYNDANIYKFMVLERLIGGGDGLAKYADIKEGFVYDDNTPVYNQLGVRTSELKFKNSGILTEKMTLDVYSDSSLYYYFEDYHLGEEEYYKDYYNNGTPESIFKHYYSDINDRNGIDVGVYSMYSPNMSKYLTDHFWIYDGNGVLIPSNYNAVYAQNEEKIGFTAERIGDVSNVKVTEIIRYLLGVNPSVYNPVLTEYNPLSILEIEPCNQFKYDNFNNVKELAAAMGYDVSGWTANNYEDYVKVTCLSTNAFNSLNDDLIAEYDVIYMGLEYDEMLTVKTTRYGNSTGKQTDSNGNAITDYNDDNLDGYVYLSYGDMLKVTNDLQGAMEYDYYELEDTASATNNGFTLVGLNGDDGDRKNNGTTIRNYKRLYMIGSYKWNDYLKETLGGNDSTTRSKYYVLKSVTDVFSGVNNVSDLLYGDNGEVGNMRLMGNDITQKKLEELREYRAAGKVFILDDYLYYYKGNDYIYETSNVYKIAEEIGWGKYENTYLTDDCYAVPSAIEKVAPEIIFGTDPLDRPVDVEYDAANGLVSNSNPDQNPVEDGYQIRFFFDVKGEANAAYSVKLCLDKNGDGLYNFEKKIDDTNELYGEKLVTLDAEGICKGIEIETTLPIELTGPIAWRVQLTKMEDGKETSVRTNESGYTTIQGTSKTVRLLQIYPYAASNSVKVTLNMETDDEFRSYLNSAARRVGFDISVDALSTVEFERLIKNNPGYVIADHYDMIILGFADAFGGDDLSNNDGALDAIETFIESGGAALFTHDTTSFITTPNYVIGTKKTTTTGGGNRPGRPGRPGSGSGGTTTTKVVIDTSNRVVTNEYDWSYNINLRFRYILGQDKYGITLDTEGRTLEKTIEPPMYLTDLAPDYTVEADDGNYYVQEIQGITDMFILRYRYSSGSFGNSTWLWPYQSLNNRSSFKSSTSYNDYGDTNTAVKINEGQITQYPYDLDESINIATTHAQNYALNLESDRDGEDIVVWYTLSGSTSKNYDIFYDVTEKDGAQNYYIYSKGNITYSGAGHSTINGVEEIKLFVNTVIRAATSGNSTPTIAIDNGNKANDGSYVVYRNEFEDGYNIMFTPKDTDLLTGYGKFTSGEILYRNTETGAETVLKTYGYGDLICGDRYNITITNQNMIDAIERKEAEFIFRATDTYGATGESVAVFSSRHLFELD